MSKQAGLNTIKGNQAESPKIGSDRELMFSVEEALSEVKRLSGEWLVELNVVLGGNTCP